jgi:TRAP-type mannitol/chloroaromatic compound transport system permease small subunit
MINEVARRLDSVTDRIGRAVAWLAAVLVLVTGTVVLLRYAFNTGSIALQESLIYINALLFTLGAAYTLKQDGHVRVDIFYSRMTNRNRALVDLGGTLFLLLPFCGFILWTSWDYVSFSWQIRERSAETSGLPFVYLLKTTIVLLAAGLLWQGVAEICKAFRLFAGGKQS